MVHRSEIEINLAVPGFMAHVRWIASRGLTNVVDKDVHSSVHLHSSCDEGFSIVRLGDIASENIDRCVRALFQETLFRSFGGRQMKVATKDLDAILREKSGCGSTISPCITVR